MAKDNRTWRQSWESRRDDIDLLILVSAQQGRTPEETLAEVGDATRGWLEEPVDTDEYAAQFRSYFESRLEDMERGQQLARQENGSFYVNPEYAPGQEATAQGTSENRLAEAAISSRSSSGSKDPADT